MSILPPIKNTVIAWMVLFILLLAVFLTADGLDVITFHPWSVHQWRQSDCYAYAKNFYNSGADLLHPAAFNLIGKEGKMASEFPVIYYVGAQICRVIGFHNFIFRGLTFLCYLVGLVYLYKVCRRYISDPFIAIFPVALLATTPFFYYYALNFLPNVPAIGLSFVGLYFMLLYEDSIKGKHLFTATTFFILSTLLKPTDGGLVWMAYVMARGLILISKRNTWHQLLPLIASSVCVAATIVMWYKYVEYYNNLNGNHSNLQSIYPIWEMTQKAIDYTYTERIYGWWLSAYQQIDVLNFVKGMFYVFAITWVWQNSFLRLFTLFIIGLTWGYNVLWFQAFCDHDYYQLVDVIPCAFVILCGFHWYDSKAAPRLPKWAKYPVWCGCLTLVVAGIVHNADVQHQRNYAKEYIEINPSIYAVGPFLKSLGLQPNDIIASEPDNSPNVTLAAYGYKGYSRDAFSMTDLTNVKNAGAKYLIINDTSAFRRGDISAFLKKPLGNYHNQIFVYDIR